MTRLRIALAQLDTTVGDLEGNADRVAAWIARARDADAQLVVFPEQALTGYPAEDLWLKPHFVERAASALARIATGTTGIVALVGFPEPAPARPYNALAVLADGALRATYHKVRLPNYGVFDERRYFEPGAAPALIELGGVRVGLTICEDIWFAGPPAADEALAGAALIVNPSASPYHHGKGLAREEMIRTRARETGAAFAVCNLVGGQDELVFDGHSVVVSAHGETLARAPQFREALLVCDLELAAREARLELEPLARLRLPEPEGRVTPELHPTLEPEEAEIYAALELGLRDYVTKNGFERVLVAVSGGIDSALVATIAADALGSERVVCVIMPSPHSSAETQADARRVARNLGAELVEIPIGSIMRAYDEALGLDRRSRPKDAGPRRVETGAGGPGGGVALAAENIQARIRGNLLMALSNRYGWLVLTTGNKSEMSVGYATLYGDMAGGFAVIKDVPKTLVYRLARYRNARSNPPPIPESVLERAPSAELRPGQRDEDSLPPYELLDRILAAYVEEDRSLEEIVADGVPPDLARAVIAMVDRAEYKRRQAAPGIKITPKAFGRDRRLPITNRFRG